MATVTNKTENDKITNRSGKVRVLDSDTAFEEMNAGHIIPGANPPKNENQRGGFGDRDGKSGFGSDSADGDTALSTNDNSAAHDFPTDGLQVSGKTDPGTTTFALDDEDDAEDDFTEVDVDTDDDFEDDDVDIAEVADDDFDTTLDDDFEDDDIDDDLNLDDEEDLDEEERY